MKTLPLGNKFPSAFVVFLCFVVFVEIQRLAKSIHLLKYFLYPVYLSYKTTLFKNNIPKPVLFGF
jgi:hypothetical protein